ncbi:hypothetical protein K2X33_13350 [bacterium]|nr:hypothetical protein [bacterium]
MKLSYAVLAFVLAALPIPTGFAKTSESTGMSKVCRRKLALDNGVAEKIAPSLSAKLRTGARGTRDSLEAQLVVNVFLPVRNRGSNPAIIALQRNLEAVGLRFSSPADLTVPSSGLKVLYAEGSSAALVAAAQLSQVLWVSRVLQARTLARLKSNASLEPRVVELRTRMERRLTTRHQRKERREELLAELEALHSLAEEQRDTSSVRAGDGRYLEFLESRGEGGRAFRQEQENAQGAEDEAVEEQAATEMEIEDVTAEIKLLNEQLGYRPLAGLEN